MDDKVRRLLVLYEDVEAADLVDVCLELFLLFSHHWVMKCSSYKLKLCLMFSEVNLIKNLKHHLVIIMQL